MHECAGSHTLLPAAAKKAKRKKSKGRSRRRRAQSNTHLQDGGPPLSDLALLAEGPTKLLEQASDRRRSMATLSNLSTVKMSRNASVLNASRAGFGSRSQSTDSQMFSGGPINRKTSSTAQVKLPALLD